MSKDDSIVKSFRTTEEQFNKANDIFQKEGFSISEVIRILLEATIREGHIPRGLSTREMEPALDDAKFMESYIDDILMIAGIQPPADQGRTAEERLLQKIFPERCGSNGLSNAFLREWAASWGFPDGLSIATLAELHDCGMFKESPWYGIYDADIRPEGRDDTPLASALITMEFQNNIMDNLEQVKREMQARAVKHLMEMDNLESDNSKSGNLESNNSEFKEEDED